MPRITIVDAVGATRVIEASTGQSVMEAAVGQMVRGIVGECGGCCSCATCHVHVDEHWYGRLTPPDEMEQGMLEGAIEPGPLSRLSCQIKVTEDLDGLIVRVPAGQA